MWLRSAQPTPSGLGNLDVGARQWRLILPKATHIEGRTAWKASLNDYHRESSIDWGTTARVIRFPISDFVGGSVSLSIGGSILMSAEATLFDDLLGEAGQGSDGEAVGIARRGDLA